MITGTTRVAGVIGSPARHSLSPTIHNAAFQAAGLDWVFLAFEVAAGEGAAAVAGMRTLGLGGLSVTMPHKTDAWAAARPSIGGVVGRDGYCKLGRREHLTGAPRLIP